MKTENLKNESFPQRDITEYEEYAEALSIYLPEDLERERKLQADHLIELIIDPKNTEKAMRRVRQNKGAPKVDGETVREVIERMTNHFAEVQASIKGGYYNPKAVRRREIPKPDEGARNWESQRQRTGSQSRQ